jgi:hypothetical protein
MILGQMIFKVFLKIFINIGRVGHRAEKKGGLVADNAGVVPTQ